MHTGDWKLDDTPYLGSLTVRGNLPRSGRRGRSRARLRFHQCRARRHEPERGRRCAQRWRELDQGCAAPGGGDHFRLQRRAHPLGRRSGSRVRTRGRGGRPRDGPGGRGRETNAAISTACRNFARPRISAICRATRLSRSLTGSQGEPRAALARIAAGRASRHHALAGDRVIFSSRTIPGNEKAVGSIINSLIEQGVEVMTDRTELVHVSGHPRRGELAQMYEWTHPRIAIPAHGEALHLAEHASFARAQGVLEVVTARNGTLVRLAPGPAEIVDKIPAGRLYRDGNIVIPAGERCAAGAPQARLSPASSPLPSPSTTRGEIAGDPVVDAMGLPEKNRQGREIDRYHRRYGGRSARWAAQGQAPRSGGRGERGASRCPRRRQPGMGQKAGLSCPGDRGLRIEGDAEP